MHIKEILTILVLVPFLLGATYEKRCKAKYFTTPALPQRSIAERPRGADVLSYFVIGDWGTGKEAQQKVARMLAEEVAALEPESRKVAPAVISVGDNIYASKKEFRGWHRRGLIEIELMTTFAETYKALRYAGKPMEFHLVPGNHDHRGDVLQQETVAEKMFSGKDSQYPIWKFYPTHFPGVADTNDEAEYLQLAARPRFELSLPQTMEISNPLVKFVALDTENLLRMYDNRKKREENISAHWKAVNKLYQAGGKSRWNIIVGHHPAVTHGTHGRDVSVRGIIERRLYRKVSHQDADNESNIQVSRDVRKAMTENGIDLFLSGHSHTLEFIDLKNRGYQIVSGAGGTASKVALCRDSIWAKQALGFVRIDVLGEKLWIEFVYLDGSQTGRTAFELTKNQ